MADTGQWGNPEGWDSSQQESSSRSTRRTTFDILKQQKEIEDREKSKIKREAKAKEQSEQEKLLQREMYIHQDNIQKTEKKVRDLESTLENYIRSVFSEKDEIRTMISTHIRRKKIINTLLKLQDTYRLFRALDRLDIRTTTNQSLYQSLNTESAVHGLISEALKEGNISLQEFPEIDKEIENIDIKSTNISKDLKKLIALQTNTIHEEDKQIYNKIKNINYRMKSLKQTYNEEIQKISKVEGAITERLYRKTINVYGHDDLRNGTDHLDREQTPEPPLFKELELSSYQTLSETTPRQETQFTFNTNWGTFQQDIHTIQRSFYLINLAFTLRLLRFYP